MEGRNGVRRWTKKKEDERRRRRIERRKISAAPSVTRGNLQLDKVVGWTPWAPIVGYTRARVSPRATFPGNGRVIPRVTQVPSATEGEIAQRKNSGADLRLSLSLSLGPPATPLDIHPSVHLDDFGPDSGRQKRGMLLVAAKAREGEGKKVYCRGDALLSWRYEMVWNIIFSFYYASMETYKILIPKRKRERR